MIDPKSDMKLYAKERLPLLKKFLALPSGIPSHDTFDRVFSLLNPKSSETALQDWITSLVPSLPPDLIALDSKSIRGSNKPTALSFVHMVSAFACGSGLSLAQIKVAPTGKLRTSCMGGSIWHSMKITARSGRIILLRTFHVCYALRETSSDATKTPILQSYPIGR